MREREWAGRWAGRTVVCIASGPSLTADDCEAARRAGHPTIVTNTTFRLCPWADVLFAFDGAWLKHYEQEARAFAGAKLTASNIGTQYGFESVQGQAWFNGYGISGTAAISLAVIAGAKRVVLLGYDAQRDGKRTHWHGSHPKGLSDAATMKSWPGKFAQVAGFAKSKGCEVLNASRSTCLQCFPRVQLTEVL